MAGTNGKGSICAYVSSMLDAYNKSDFRSSGPAIKGKNEPGTPRHDSISHGRFTSPHLIDRWDCITINQKPVSFGIFDAVEKKVKQRNEAEKINASEFELLTATAFEIFNEQQIDVGVIEVGMGGRLDATNIIGLQGGIELPPNTSMETFRPLPLVTAITSLGLDHQAFLGDTLEKIAREKAGIIKPSVPVVYDNSDAREDMQAAFKVIENVAAENACPVLSPIPFFSAVELEDRLADWIVTLDLPGHTQTNAAVAFTATWAALQQLGRVSPPQRMEQEQRELALSMLDIVPTTTVPGRQQKISIETLTGRREPVLLDGAHNYESAVSLVESVEELRRVEREDAMSRNAEPSPVTWVVAVSNSKDPIDVLGPLLTNADPVFREKEDRVFAVEFGPVGGMPWVTPSPASQIMETIASMSNSTVNPRRMLDCGRDITRALRLASETAQGGPLVIAGSLYLVQDVLRLLRDCN